MKSTLFTKTGKLRKKYILALDEAWYKAADQFFESLTKIDYQSTDSLNKKN